jgi:hypothetical protein
VDAELWALELDRERVSMIENFSKWCQDTGIEIVDSVQKPTIVIFRLKLNRPALSSLLDMRDVRQVDLPPRYQLELNLLHPNIEEIGSVPTPPDESPGVVVLDSGLATAHPLLESAVGDSQSFIEGKDATDANEHGTLVGGLALYGDIEECLSAKSFAPQLKGCW